jgi:hypothetical protein
MRIIHRNIVTVNEITRKEGGLNIFREFLQSVQKAHQRARAAGYNRIRNSESEPRHTCKVKRGWNHAKERGIAAPADATKL